MAYGIVEKKSTQSLNIDSLVRSAINTSDNIENGSVFGLNSLSTTAGEGEVWVASQPSSGAGLQNIWMAAEPEVVITVSGTKEYKGIDPDPRDFVNLAGKVFTAFQPKVGDIIELSADAITGTIGANTFAVATASQYKLAWAAAAVSGLSLSLLSTEYFSIADGSIGNQRVTAYRFLVTAVA